ncbi:MAG: hypothetical protein SFY92_09675 [Verrucomicrobiae bacterium]|nr:hypothetical protein [Verrucomicrobiae bacterium]
MKFNIIPLLFPLLALMILLGDPVAAQHRFGFQESKDGTTLPPRPDTSQEENHFLEETRASLKEGDYPNAEVSAAQILKLNPANVEGKKLMTHIQMTRKNNPSFFYRTARFRKLEVEKLKVDSAGFEAVMDLLKNIHAQSAQEKKGSAFNVVYQLGDYKPREVTLDLRSVSLWDIFTLSARLAEVDYTVDAAAIIVRPPASYRATPP